MRIGELYIAVSGTDPMVNSFGQPEKLLHCCH